MTQVKLYQSDDQAAWNRFVASSKNGIFLFYRDYMDYHADRFTDHSLMFFDSGRLAALLPANLAGETLASHGGLTFGGVVSDKRMNVPLMMDVFEALHAHAAEVGIKRIVYKAIPHIYHQYPAEEDLYALFAHHARLYRRDVSSTIPMASRWAFAKGRRGCVKKGQARGIEVRRSDDFETFMAIDERHLQTKHHKCPVHTAAEIGLLASRFPNNIQLYAAYHAGTMLGGAIMYDSQEVAHAQYIAATDEGKEAGALDVLLDILINKVYASKRYFDFGISTDRDGQYLDVGLVSNKESFGARTTVYDFYELTLNS
jgi:hypothetical protein